MLGGSEIAAHSAQNTSNLKDDGSTPIIITMLLFAVSFGILYSLTNVTIIGSFVCAALLTISMAVPYFAWTHQKRKKLLKLIQEEQMRQLREQRK